ncbi:gliding motility lipoprotein GldJ [Fulvivirga lutea]|uniref:Gliding motility lipoprotein GldJ n=1 Tax=Fulvivirga lutea TaxID=2810512 RepID=A0A975A1I7_9BACT|nr:gliding motility lipoprotein GldJ [Fulvivirga lutea]QSE98290.1 gliding motility lipoprotein GldJ [Fulvivirga lutea]
MKRTAGFFKSALLVVGGSMMLTSCFLGGGGGRPTSSHPGALSTATGLAYNDEDNNGFEVKPYAGQPEGPNLVFIEGGRAIVGSFEEDILNRRDNIERTVSVASFYMDETEIANIHWLEYLHYLNVSDSSREVYIAALPDTTVWEARLAYNDPYVDHYLRYPGFRYFPVVGVSWVQANNYGDWRTAAVNQKLYEDSGEELPETSGGRIPLESGIVLPNYRLPSEAEWEYAATALIGTQWLDENQTHQRLYPWDGHALRNPYGKEMGYFLANFKRGRGDYAGIAGKLNDGALITSYIYEFPPNDFGLYNMAGNVSEWVLDVYRPMSFQDFEDLNPIRRDGYMDETSGYDSDIENNPEGFTSLITDESRVYKGGSWKDVAYWMSPGTRRYLDQDSSTATIGFRCAMIRAGSNY